MIPLPPPSLYQRIPVVLWATIITLVACAAMLVPACSALESAAKETSAIGRAGKAVEGQADGVKTDAQAARDALAKARETGGVGPEAEPFRRGGGDGDRLDPVTLWRAAWVGPGGSGAGGIDPSALDGRAGQSAGVDGPGEVDIDWRGLPGGTWSGDLFGSWGLYETGYQAGGQPGQPGDGIGSETRRGSHGLGGDGPGGGDPTASAVGDAGPSLRSLVRRIFQGGEDGSGGSQDAAAYPRYGHRIALAGLSDAGYLDLIVCVLLAFFCKWTFIRFGSPIKDIVAALLARLIGWVAVKVGAPVVPSTPTPGSPTLKPPGE